MKKIKIIHILHHSPSWTSKFVIDDVFDGWHVRTVKALQKEINFDCELEIWTLEKQLSRQIEFKIDDIVYRIFPSEFLNYGREISRSLISQLQKERENYLILHLHGIFNYHTYLISQLFGQLPIVAQHHGDAPPLYLLERRTLLLTVLPVLLTENFIMLRSLNNIDYFFCLTQSCINALKNLGIKSQMKTQTMGVDFNKFFYFPKSEAKQKLKIPVHERILLYVGRLTKYKGADKLINAFCQLKSESNIKCIVIGADKNDPYYLDAQKVGIKILSRIEHEALVSYYQAADIFILPGSSSFNKWGGIGVATIEALATNTPVISGTLKHFPEDYHKLGICTYKPHLIATGVKQILSNPQAYNECRTLAQKYYDWKHIAQSTILVYNELLKKYYKLNINKQ
ncbi:MAG: glycosyltransferase family 4 protein [candidate division WOR-3 bacterium]|nr:glycosyltransferase family 4 protein [candidate division WOR-3 bacterium]